MDIKRTLSPLLVLAAFVMVACPPPAPGSSPAPPGASSGAAAPIGSRPAAVPVADCSACGKTPCTVMGGRNFCAQPVNPESSAELDAHLDQIVSLRSAELRAGRGPCTLIGCECCNECAGGPMLFRPSNSATFKRGQRELTFAIRPLRSSAPLACGAYRECQPPQCELTPGKYDAIGTLHASDMGWDLELLAIEPSAP